MEAADDDDDGCQAAAPVSSHTGWLLFAPAALLLCDLQGTHQHLQAGLVNITKLQQLDLDLALPRGTRILQWLRTVRAEDFAVVWQKALPRLLAPART